MRLLDASAPVFPVYWCNGPSVTSFWDMIHVASGASSADAEALVTRERSPWELVSALDEERTPIGQCEGIATGTVSIGEPTRAKACSITMRGHGGVTMRLGADGSTYGEARPLNPITVVVQPTTPGARIVEIAWLCSHPVTVAMKGPPREPDAVAIERRGLLALLRRAWQWFAEAIGLARRVPPPTVNATDVFGESTSHRVLLEVVPVEPTQALALYVCAWEA